MHTKGHNIWPGSQEVVLDFQGSPPDVTKTWKVAQEVTVGGSCDRVSDQVT